MAGPNPEKELRRCARCWKVDHRALTVVLQVAVDEQEEEDDEIEYMAFSASRGSPPDPRD